MEDGRLPISNNLCEANIKPFATARRAWLFADTPKGAFANGVLYTLVESARANNLDIYEYLKYLLTEMPNNHHLEHPEIIDRYLPWSPELPDTCRLKIRNKKCFKWICSEYNKKTSVMHYAFFWSTYRIFLNAGSFFANLPAVSGVSSTLIYNILTGSWHLWNQIIQLM